MRRPAAALLVAPVASWVSASALFSQAVKHTFTLGATDFLLDGSPFQLIGPQKRLYCPAPWLKAGANDVMVFDLHQTAAAPLRGAPALE